MLEKRLVQVYFPKPYKVHRSSQSRVIFEFDPVLALVNLTFPRVDVPYGQVSKASIFGPLVLAERRIIQLRNGNCVLIDDNVMYRVDEVSLLSRRRNAVNLRCLEDGYEPEDIVRFVQFVADGHPITVMGNKLGLSE